METIRCISDQALQVEGHLGDFYFYFYFLNQIYHEVS